MTKSEFVQLISDKIDGGTTFPAQYEIQNIYVGNESVPGGCYYGQEGDSKHCFIGILIPENHPGIEYQGPVTSLLECHPDIRQYMPENATGRELLACQRVHDSWASSYRDNDRSAEAKAEYFKKNKEYILMDLRHALKI